MSCGRAKAIWCEAALFSVFVRRMQVLCQWLWVLRAEGRAWQVLKWVGLLSVGAASDL